MAISLLPVVRIYSFDSSSSAKELLADLRSAVQTSASVMGTLHGSSFVLSGRSRLAGGYRRHFYGRVVDTGGASTIEGSFHLLPFVRVLLFILVCLVLLAGVATSIEQRIVTPGLVAVLVVLGGVLVIGRQINRSASGEEAVVNLLIDVAKGS